MATASLSMGQKARASSQPTYRRPHSHLPTVSSPIGLLSFPCTHIFSTTLNQLATDPTGLSVALELWHHATVLAACISWGPHTPVLPHVPQLGDIRLYHGSAILSAQTHSALEATCRVLLQTRGGDSNIRRA